MGINNEKSVNKMLKNRKNIFNFKNCPLFLTSNPRLVIKNITKNSLIDSSFDLYTYSHP